MMKPLSIGPTVPCVGVFCGVPEDCSAAAAGTIAIVATTASNPREILERVAILVHPNLRINGSFVTGRTTERTQRMCRYREPHVNLFIAASASDEEHSSVIG